MTMSHIRLAKLNLESVPVGQYPTLHLVPLGVTGFCHSLNESNCFEHIRNVAHSLLNIIIIITLLSIAHQTVQLHNITTKYTQKMPKSI